jgi:hypothetical protein
MSQASQLQEPLNGHPYAREAEGRLTFPHAWFWPIAIVSLFSLGGVCEQRQAMLGVAWVWHIVEVVLLCAFTYRLWNQLQDGKTEITPGKAVGYLFIPFVGLYWIFRVWAGYATAFNRFCERHGLPCQASKRITTTFTITWLLGKWLALTPVGPVLGLVGWIAEMVFVAHTGKLTSNLTVLTAPAARVEQ